MEKLLEIFQTELWTKRETFQKIYWIPATTDGVSLSGNSKEAVHESILFDPVTIIPRY